MGHRSYHDFEEAASRGEDAASEDPVLRTELTLNARHVDKYPAKQHAQRVASFLGEKRGLIYLAGAPTKLFEDSDQQRSLRQRRYFYYLSGVEEADCHLLYDLGKDLLTLYIPAFSERQAIWNGAGPSKTEALDKYDVDAVEYVDQLEATVRHWSMMTKDRFYILHPSQSIVLDPSDSRVDYIALAEAMNAARVIKDAHEVELIRQANNVSALAHRRVLESIARLTNETQVEATFLKACVGAGAKHQAYEIIAASGVNASVLHYVKNDDTLKNKWLMCLDAGAEWSCYASDVTRTFPVSGTWPSKEAKAIYDLVADMQTACIQGLRPGVMFRDLNFLSHFTLVKGLLSLGILQGGSVEEILGMGTSLLFCPHGLGHHVGLEVHDVAPLRLYSGSTAATDLTWLTNAVRGLSPTTIASISQQLANDSVDQWSLTTDISPLEAGMVLTVEPGIYFHPTVFGRVLSSPSPHRKFINASRLMQYMPVGGVRIEDDLLITENGYENLTTAPKGEEALAIMREQRG